MQFGSEEILMRRLLGFTIFALLLSLTGAGTASATTYYVAANGSDSNNGTTKTTPWLHAPGMPSCTGVCASTTPVAGDRIILRGGDTWHYSSGTPATGGQWTFNQSGSSANRIYIGVDQTWFSAGSWTRPIFNMDNPLTTSVPSSCAYDDSNLSALRVNGNYVDTDNFEFTGKCWAQTIGNNSVGYYFYSGTNDLIEHSYFHGWSMTQGAWDSHAAISGTGTNGSGNSGNTIAYNVIDGSDSTHSASAGVCSSAVNGAPCNTGWGIEGDCYATIGNVIRYTSNAMECGNITIVHDNLIEYTFATINGNTLGGPHPNIIETVDGYTGQAFIFYNNIIRHNGVNVGIWPQFATGYFFNNVFFDNESVQSANCIMMSPVGNSGGSAASTVYFYNNTIIAGCRINFYGQNGNNTTKWVGGTVNFANNHFIGYSTAALSSLYIFGPNASGTINDLGNEVYQTTAAANGQGYVPGNSYAPTLVNNSTVGGGGNLSASCTTFSSDSALCSGTSGASSEGPGFVALYPAISIVPRPTSGLWNAGAYEFSSSSASRPNPPTGLTVVVQ
jgi:hypothetical protein